MNTTDTNEDLIEQFDRRYRQKKYVNLVVALLIVIFGISSFIYGLHIDPHITILRFMTVDGTLFTTLGSLAALFVNHFEIKRNTELTNRTVYYIRLSSAVAEMVIFLVVIISHLPFSTESIPVFDRYDSFIMHAVLPILTVTSFAVNDSPRGRLRPLARWHGTWFVTFYAVIILLLIGTGIISGELIPYFFLDVANNPAWLTLTAFIIIYSIAYLMSWFLSELNRKLSWRWFKGFFRTPGRS